MTVKIKNSYVIRLAHGVDLLDALREQCRQRAIRMGVLSVIGAVHGATIGYYDQKEKAYQNKNIAGELEIASCTGNISLKDGDIMVHAHLLLSDATGTTYGGHLLSPTTLFAAEAFIQELDGDPLEPEYDSVTGLFLWRMKR